MPLLWHRMFRDYGMAVKDHKEISVEKGGGDAFLGCNPCSQPHEGAETLAQKFT